MSFHDHVKDLRIRKQIGLRQLCAQCGLDPSNWSKFERGMSPPPGDALALDRIAALLDLKADEKQQLADLIKFGHQEIPVEVIAKPVAIEGKPPAPIEEFTKEVRRLIGE